MRNAQVAQVAAGLLVATTPWIVVRIARAVATRHLHAVGAPVSPFPARPLLGRATAMAVLLVGTLAALLPAPSAWIAVIEAVQCFSGCMRPGFTCS